MSNDDIGRCLAAVGYRGDGTSTWRFHSGTRRVQVSAKPDGSLRFAGYTDGSNEPTVWSRRLTPPYSADEVRSFAQAARAWAETGGLYAGRPAP